MNPLYILLGLILLLSSCIDKSKEEALPNIIWLMAEDISLDLGCYGMKGVKTPTLDNMAKNGWKFNNYIIISQFMIHSHNRGTIFRCMAAVLQESP